MPPPGDSGHDDVTVAQTGALNLARTATRARPQLRWSDSAGAHETLIARRVVLGASPDVDLVIADRAVSRLHAELEPRPDGVWVRDLGSRNGTYVDGIRVESAQVPDGATIRVGATDLALAYDREPARVELYPGMQFGPLIGVSVAMRELFATLARVAATSATVLIRGETGTGKELVARAIHEASPRRGHPFVVVDCAALPENLLEAELFGHTKGAFTGAASAREGAIESAEGGTVFLDEIGEVPLAMQPKLLRVIESRTVRRVGETQHRKVDVRFLSATHRDLRTMVNAGAFREDLYFRLAVLPVTVPPLRERPEDIAPLVAHFVPDGMGAGLDAGVMKELASRPWLGNARELRNFVERALVLGPARALAMDGEMSAMASASGGPRGGARAAFPPVDIDRPFKDIRDEWQDHLEREYIRGLLERHGRSMTAVANAAGLDRAYIYRLVRKHQL